MTGFAPAELRTSRLVLRRPVPADAPAMFDRYTADPEVTRFLAWPRHRALADTRGFVTWSDHVWSTAPAGPYVILDGDGELIGSTGLDVETPWRAATGFVLTRAAWGQGYATEVAVAMRLLAVAIGMQRLYALCHPDNRASARVLEKAGFVHECVLRRYVVLPNLDPDRAVDVDCWAHT
jgi:RimJ/RimL family protein N-acetyltransferase